MTLRDIFDAAESIALGIGHDIEAAQQTDLIDWPLYLVLAYGLLWLAGLCAVAVAVAVPLAFGKVALQRFTETNFSQDGKPTTRLGEIVHRINDVCFLLFVFLVVWIFSGVATLLIYDPYDGRSLFVLIGAPTLVSSSTIGLALIGRRKKRQEEGDDFDH